MADAIQNLTVVTVSGGYNAAATSITLQSGHGARLPDPSVAAYNLVWWASSLYANPAKDPNVEIVRVTAKVGDVLTVTRAQESTSATTKNTDGATYEMHLGVTAKTITDIYAAINAGGILSVVEDTTPQLGGDLDLNGFNLDFPTTPNISDVLDEDTMASDSATSLATQQSIKAYVDANSGGASQLSDLSDVNTSTPTNRNVLVADGVDFESRALVEADISDLGSYANASHTHVEADITDLGTYLTDITGENIADLSDVVVTTPADNEVLAYDNGSGNWINQTAAEAGLAAASHTHTESDITDLGAYITASSTDTLTNKSGNISQWTNDAGYITATLTQEQVEDYVGGLLTDSSEIDFTYNDVGGTLTAAIVAGSIDETKLDTSTNASLDLADSSVQPGDNVSDLTNDAGYLTSIPDNYLLNTGDIGTGVYDFGGATSFELPNSATPTVDADGEIAFDTTVTDFSTGLLKFYGNEEQGVVSMPIAQFTSPTDGYVVAYNATNDEFELVAQSGGGGTPGGSDTFVQYNDGGSFGGEDDFKWDDSTKTLTIGNTTDTAALVLPARNDAVTPSLEFGAGTGNGIYSSPASTDSIVIASNGALHTLFSQNLGIYTSYPMLGSGANAAQVEFDETASTTNPVFVPYRSNGDTGIGYDTSSGGVVLIGDGNNSLVASSTGVTVTATATTNTPLSVLGITSQTAPIFAVSPVGGTTGFRVKSTGVPYTTGLGAGFNSVFGDSATASGQQGVAYGDGATVGGQGVSIGRSSQAAAGVSVGWSASGTGTGTNVIGLNAEGGSYTHSHAHGRNATVTANNQWVTGSVGYEVTQAYWGGGVTSTTPVDFTMNATGASGTDVAAANFTIAGGRGTGSGAGGHLIFQTAAAGGSGSSLNSLSTILELTDDAAIGFYGVTPTTRQVLATGAGATVDNVITALQNLGLVSQS